MIELSPHAKKRVEERKISIKEIEKALLDPDELLWLKIPFTFIAKHKNRLIAS